MATPASARPTAVLVKSGPPLGRVSQFTIDKTAVVEFVEDLEQFSCYVQRVQAKSIASGIDFKAAVYTDEAGKHLVIANAKRFSLDDIDQDSSYRRRRQFASLIRKEFGRGRGKQQTRFRKVALPSELQKLSCRSAFPNPDQVSGSDVMAVCTSNTQKIFDALQDARKTGRADSLPAIVMDLRSAGYKHTVLFSEIYAGQIRRIEQLLAETEHLVTVADIGASRGHFVATAARHLVAKGLVSRVRFIAVDSDEECVGWAKKIIGTMGGVEVEWVVKDIFATGFMDWLRRQEPDIIVLNHVLEHVKEQIENRVLHPLLEASKKWLCISVPLDDSLEDSISEHEREFSVETLAKLAHSIEGRTAFAVRAVDLDMTARFGCCDWQREPPTRHYHGSPLIVVPGATVPARGVLLADFEKPFDPREFNRGRRALPIGEIQGKTRFAAPGQNPRQVRQLLIKDRNTDICLPGEFADRLEAVHLIADHNQAINPRYDECYAYLNIYCGPTQADDYRGLSLSLHGDQLQSLIWNRPYIPDYSYIVSTTLPTKFWEQPFDASSAVARAKGGLPVDLYQDFIRQQREEFAYYSENFVIYLLSPYIVHAAQLASRTEHRVFLKIAFSLKRFWDNRELRHNGAFEYGDWFEEDTVGYSDGFLHHAHWNERFVMRDLL